MYVVNVCSIDSLTKEVMTEHTIELTMGKVWPQARGRERERDVIVLLKIWLHCNVKIYQDGEIAGFHDFVATYLVKF